MASPSYRYPTEHRTLALTIAAALVVTLVIAPLTAGAAVVVVVGGFGLNWLMTTLSVSRIKRSATPIARFPELAALVEQCSQRLDLRDDIEVYVVRRPTINAYAVGFLRPYTVVLYTGLLEVLDRDELTFVIGHELGHVTFRHTSILALIGQLGNQTYGFRGLGFLIRAVFLSWMRAGEYTADRAGLVACRRLDKALSTQLTLAVGPERSRRVDLDRVIAHWRAHDVSLRDQLGDVLSTHPGTEARMDKLVDFAHSEQGAELLGRQRR